MDDPRHEPLNFAVDGLARVDRSIEDAIVADPQAMPWPASGQWLDVEGRRTGCQLLECLANPQQPLPRPDASQVPFGTPGKDYAAHGDESAGLNLGEDHIRRADSSSP